MGQSRGEWSWQREVAQESAPHASVSWLESSDSALIIRFITVNLKELAYQLKRKNPQLNTWIDIFKAILVNAHLCNFCPKRRGLISAGEALIIRKTEMAATRLPEEMAFEGL